MAGIAIQSSWFLLGALLDVSTVATYGLGSMPLSVIEGTDVGKHEIISYNAHWNFKRYGNGNTVQPPVVFYRVINEENIPRCIWGGPDSAYIINVQYTGSEAGGFKSLTADVISHVLQETPTVCC